MRDVSHLRDLFPYLSDFALDDDLTSPRDVLRQEAQACLHRMAQLEQELSVARGLEEPEPNWGLEGVPENQESREQAHTQPCPNTATHDEHHYWLAESHPMGFGGHSFVTRTMFVCPGVLDPNAALQDLRERVEKIETLLRAILDANQAGG